MFKGPEDEINEDRKSEEVGGKKGGRAVGKGREGCKKRRQIGRHEREKNVGRKEAGERGRKRQRKEVKVK